MLAVHSVCILSNLLAESGAREPHRIIGAPVQSQGLPGTTELGREPESLTGVMGAQKTRGQLTEGPAAFLWKGRSFLHSCTQRTVGRKKRAGMGGLGRALL